MTNEGGELWTLNDEDGGHWASTDEGGGYGRRTAPVEENGGL